jgi:hypothetical protein
MRQFWTPYWDWEDWKNKMWVKSEFDLHTCVKFTGDTERYGAAMQEVIYKWPNTMLNSLTNPSINKRAFLGHCAASLEINCPEYVTRMAWRELSDQQRELADAVAQKTINEWKERYRIILTSGAKDATEAISQMKALLI